MNKRYILILFFSLIYFLYWRSYPTFVDEKWTMAIANGVGFNPEEVFHKIDSVQLDQMKAEELYLHNTPSNVFKACISDGGNGQFYYQIAHAVVIVFAPIMGVFNSLKALSVLCSLIMVLIFYDWLKRVTHDHPAFIAALFLTAVSASFNIYVRNYAMSNMFCVLFFREFHFYLLAKNQGINRSHPWLVVCMIVLPFIHFFNLFILLISCLPVLWFVLVKKRSWLRYRLWILSGLACASLFLFYYIQLNETGRHYQQLVSAHFRWFATQYGGPLNSWLAPLAPRFFLSENLELLLRITGLDLRDSFRWLRMSWFAILLIFPMGMISMALIHSRNPLHRSMRAVLIFILLSVVAYLALLNLVYVFSGHAIALNSQWYASPLYALVGAACAIALAVAASKIWQRFVVVYVAIVTLNAVGYSFNPEMRIENDAAGTTFIAKIEQQFDESEK